MSLVLPSGQWTDIELTMNARLLTAEDRLVLKEKWRRGLGRSQDKHAAALLDGLSRDLERIYLERRQVKTGMPIERFQEKAGVKTAFRAAAAWCFDENVELDRLVACAESICRSSADIGVGNL